MRLVSATAGVFFVFGSGVFGASVQSIEHIANEVHSLRVGYEKCQTEKKNNTLKDSKISQEENKKLQEELHHSKISEKKLQKKVLQLEKKVDELKKTIALLKLTQQKKAQPKQELALSEEKKVVLRMRKKDVMVTKPTTYRTKRSCGIYARVGGSRVATWESGVSFTSYLATKKYLKVTGYFVNGKWRKAKKELWIKKEDTLKRG